MPAASWVAVTAFAAMLPAMTAFAPMSPAVIVPAARMLSPSHVAGTHDEPSQRLIWKPLLESNHRSPTCGAEGAMLLMLLRIPPNWKLSTSWARLNKVMALSAICAPLMLLDCEALTGEPGTCPLTAVPGANPLSQGASGMVL